MKTVVFVIKAESDQTHTSSVYILSHTNNMREKDVKCDKQKPLPMLHRQPPKCHDVIPAVLLPINIYVYATQPYHTCHANTHTLIWELWGADGQCDFYQYSRKCIFQKSLLQIRESNYNLCCVVLLNFCFSWCGDVFTHIQTYVRAHIWNSITTTRQRGVREQSRRSLHEPQRRSSHII